MGEPIRCVVAAPPAIPDFMLVEKCGAGASGTIYLGIDRDGIRRAVRVLRCDVLAPEQLAAEKAAVGRYRNLIHGERNLIDVLYTGETPEALYYVMPLADSLADRRCKYIPATLAARIGGGGRDDKLNEILSVVAAVRRMHEKGLAHRDLKPENILYIDGEPVIADPGSCAPCGEVADVGTPGYKPPLPSRGDTADIHALGKIVYTLFSGYPPERYPDIPAGWNDDFYAAVDRIVLKCCGTGPENYRDATELYADLLALEKRRSRKKRPALLTAFAAVLGAFALLAAVLVTVHGLKTSDPRPAAETPTLSEMPHLAPSIAPGRRDNRHAAMHGGR